MKTVYLHGELADKFTNKVVLDIHSVGEAIRALRVNFKGFADYMHNYTPGFHIRIGDIYKDEKEINDLVSDNDDIHIIPAVAGSGKLGTIIIGAFLIWATWGVGATATLAGNTTASALGAGWASGVTGAAIASQIGVGLVLSGISAILFAPPKATVNQKEENTPNTYFNGAVNTIAQGNPVPIGYGELIVGSAVISAGISVDSIGTSNTNVPWLFSEAGKDGWIEQPANVYLNENTNIYFNQLQNTYYHTTTKNVDPSFYRISCYINENNEEICYQTESNGDVTMVAKPSSTVAITYRYNPITGMYKRHLPTCTFYDNNNVYCSEDGSGTKPEEWGTK